ncbi:MAG: hypothetical protein U1F54_00175 [Burkholderiales bacterium]
MTRRRTSLRIDRIALSLPAMSEADARAVARAVAQRIAARLPAIPRPKARVVALERGAAPDATIRAVERAIYGEDT